MIFCSIHGSANHNAAKKRQQAGNGAEAVILNGSEDLDQAHDDAGHKSHRQQRRAEPEGGHERLPDESEWRIPGSCVEAFHQRTDHQVPAVGQNEEQNFERSGNHHRRQLHHADRKGDRGDHQVDDQERQKEDGADLKAGFQLGEDIGRNQNFQVQVGGLRGAGACEISTNSLTSFSRAKRIRKALSGLVPASKACAAESWLFCIGSQPWWYMSRGHRLR